MSDDEYGSFDEEEAAEAVSLIATTPARQQLQQRTLWGGLAQVQTSPGAATYSATRNRQRNRDEPPTHLFLDQEALKTWIYPTNYPQRDYQFNMIKKALYTNLLVALPTGLGKTFIAAVVMYNYYRWAPKSKIIFLAPAKPLVTQQIEACYHVCGIPAREIAELTGGIDKSRRNAAYQERRLFFLTPQTFQNDLRNGLVNAKDVSCLVVDEAHHATGNYAYVEVVRLMRVETSSFRVLALTATPGKSVETVQEVIDGLNISQIEIRSEASIDIRPYTHTKEVETILLDLTPEMSSIQTKYASLLKPMMQRLASFGVGMTQDPTKVSAFQVREAVSRFQRESRAGGRANSQANAAFAIGGILASLAYNMEMLNTHGIRPFYDLMIDLRSNVKTSENKKRIIKDPNFTSMMQEIEPLIADPVFTGHPKLDYLSGLILNHFQKAQEESNEETRVMVFSSLRASADVIVSTLQQHAPLLKPTPFFGQQAGKSGSGMSQKEQQETIKSFKKGIFNVIVATSVGEEGLDIGEVDMIICYDSSSSPARMLQRMGRTGRKRDGQVFVLCVRGKEENAFVRAKDAHRVMQKKIENGIDIKLAEDVPRIIPWNINPECEKRLLEVPVGDKISDRELKTAARKKKEAKVFTMPDGVTTGFVSAGALTSGRKRKSGVVKPFNIDQQLWDYESDSNSGLLDSTGRQELETRFRNIDQDHAGCNIDARNEQGMYLSRDEIRNIARPVLISHGVTTKVIKNLVQKRFKPITLRRMTDLYQATVSAGQDVESLHAAIMLHQHPDEPIDMADDRISDSDSGFINDESSSKRRLSVIDSDDDDDDDAVYKSLPPRMSTLTKSTSAPIDIVAESDASSHKKMRLSQLARESDDEELPDTANAIRCATSYSPAAHKNVPPLPTLHTRDRNNETSSTSNQGRQQRNRPHRPKIRIIDEEASDD